MMLSVDKVEGCVALCRDHSRRGRSVGFVPTMGALHSGHRSLMHAARASCDFVVVSIFVNPKQFGQGEDLACYPRTLAQDLEACREEGVDLVFAPATPAEIYPPGFQTKVSAGELAKELEGRSRVGHFDGVVTVVTKLFGIVRPDMAFFGEKDFQQLAIIRRLVSDLNMDVQVVGCPTVRDHDGLALSSRNSYFSEPCRPTARCVPDTLRAVQDAFSKGQREVAALRVMAEEALRANSSGAATLHYLAFAQPEELKALSDEAVCSAQTRVLLSVELPSTRGTSGEASSRVHLIDNIAIGEDRI